MATESENYSKYFLFIGSNNKLDWCCLVNVPAYSLSFLFIGLNNKLDWCCLVNVPAYSLSFLFIGLNNKLDWCCLVNVPAYSLSFLFIGSNNKLDWCCLVNFPAYSLSFLFIGSNNKLDWCCLVNFPAYSLSLDGHYIQRPWGSLSGTCGDGKLLLAKPWSTDFHWVSLSRQNWSWLERGKAAWMNAIMPSPLGFLGRKCGREPCM